MEYKTAAAGDGGLVASSWLSSPLSSLDTLKSLFSLKRCKGGVAPVNWSLTVYLWKRTDLQYPCTGLDGAKAVKEPYVCGTEATVRVGLGVEERLRPECFVCAVRCCFTISKCLL